MSCWESLCHVSCGILLALAVYLVGNAASVTALPGVAGQISGPGDEPICLGGLTGVEFDKPIVSVRLGKASDGLGMTLAKSNFSNYMSGGSSGYFFMKYFQPKRSQQGQRAMCTPHRMLLTIVYCTKCMGPRLMCGLLLDSFAPEPESKDITLSHNSAENFISCSEGHVLTRISVAQPHTFSCILLEPINVSADVPSRNNTSVVGFGSVLMNTMMLTDRLGRLPPSSITVLDISSAVDVARDVEVLFDSSNLTGNLTQQLIEQTLTLYDVVHRGEVVINDAASFQLFESLIYILERIGYLFPPLVGMSETFAAQSISQTLIDVSDQDILRTVRYTLDSVIGGGEDDDTVTQGSDIDLSTSSHESSLIDEYDDEDFVTYLQVDVLPATFGMSSCRRYFGNSACVHRIQMNMYSNDQFFPGETMNTSVDGSISGEVGSVIAGVALNNAAPVMLASNKTAIRIHFRPFRNALDNETMHCAYWDFDIDDGVGGAGGWRTDGCRLNTSMLNSMVAICECNHLTNFAIVIARNATASRAFNISLHVGFGISAICILVAICLQVAALKVLDHGNQQFKQRRSRLTVLLILSVNLLLLYITQTASSYAQGGTLLCWIFLIPAHYFNLSVFLSIGLEGISLYYTVVNVFQKEVSNFRLKALLLVQGIPAVIVLLCASIAQSSYYRPPENNSYCWINIKNAVFYAGYLPIIVLVLIVNSIIAVRVACLLRKLQSQSKNSVSIRITLQRARASLVIFFVLGFGWLPVVIIVFLPTPSTALLWIATIFIILQGVAVLLFQIQSESMLIRKAFRSISVSFGAAGRPKSVGGTSDGAGSGAQMPATEGNKLQNGSLSGGGDP